MDDLNEPLRAEKKRLEERLALILGLLGETKVKEPAKGQRYKVNFPDLELPSTFTSTQFNESLKKKVSAPTLSTMLGKFEAAKMIRKIKPASGRAPAVYVKLKTLLGYGPVGTKTKVHSKGHR